MNNNYYSISEQRAKQYIIYWHNQILPVLFCLKSFESIASPIRSNWLIFLKSSLWFLQITSFQPCPVSSLKTLCEIVILRSEELTTVFHGTMATIARKNRPGSIIYHHHQYIIRIFIINISHNFLSHELNLSMMEQIFHLIIQWWWWSFINIFRCQTALREIAMSQTFQGLRSFQTLSK